MAGEIFVWWLTLSLGGYTGTTTLPVPFPTQAACMWAAEEAQQQFYACIPQPAADLAQFSMLSSTEGNVCEIGKP